MTIQNDKKNERTQAQPAHPTDLAFHYLESPTTPQNIACLITLDRNPDLPCLSERFTSVLEFFPRLKSVLRIPTGLLRRRASWIEDPAFKLSEHIEVYMRPQLQTHEEMIAEASKVFPIPLNLHKARWKFIILTNRPLSDRRSKAAAVGLLVFHHSVTDGLGGMEVMNALTAERPPHESNHRRSRRGALPVRVQFGPFVMFRACRTIWSMLRARPGKLLPAGNSRYREIACGTVPLTALRQFRRTLGGSLNDAFLYAVTGAVKEIVLERKQPSTAQKKGAENDPVAIMPISLRSLHARNELGNYLTAVGIPLPVQETDSKAQMARIQKSTAPLKEGKNVRSYILLSELGARLPRKLQPYFFRSLARTTSFICTNLPESAQPRALAGATILQKYAIPALMEGHGLGFGLMTYAQQACFAVTTDPATGISGDDLIAKIQERCLAPFSSEIGGTEEVTAVTHGTSPLPSQHEQDVSTAHRD